MSDQVSVTVTRQDKYRFLVDFGAGLERAVADEPPPIGEGTGPSPPHFLAAAVANCLSASLVFAVAKFKGDPGAITTTATCQYGRNEHHRLRITGMSVAMTLGVAPDSLAHLDRALSEFEEFCTVSQSVRAGIPFTVTVKGADGHVLK